MSTPELRLRASLWNLLSTRRDIDHLTLELLGKYHVDVATAKPDIADNLSFSLACQLEAIFDLQRTHLQSRTPYSEFDNELLVSAARERVAERIPYLLSLSVAKGAFTTLRKLALRSVSEGRDGESLLRQVVFVRALISGVRMLCLHPGVEPGMRLESLLKDESPLDNGAISTYHGILTEVCEAALKKVPNRHRDLHLPRMGYNREMFPLDESRVMKVVKECTIGFDLASIDNYWTLYDISWSVVGSYVQFWAIKKDVDMAPSYFASVAMDIVVHAIEARRPLKSSEDSSKCAALLLDIAAALSPILLDLKVEVESKWRENYEKILREHHIPNYRDYFTEKKLALEKFEAVLERRERVLRDSNEELPKLLESIQKQCSDDVKRYNRHFPDRPTRRQSEHDSQPTTFTRLYVVSCDSTHIITEDEITRLSEFQGLLKGKECFDFPEGFVCPLCPLRAKLAKCIREISPLTKILETAEQKKRDLRKLRQDREHLAQDPGEHSGSQIRYLEVAHITADQSTSSHQGHRDQRGPSESMASSSEPSVHSDLGPVESPPTSTSTAGGSSFWPKLARRWTLSPTPAGSSEQEPFSLDLHPLGLHDKQQIAVSSEYKCFILWTTGKLGLYYDTSEQEPVVVTNPVKKPGQMAASADYCAIVKRERSYDEIVFTNPNDRFNIFATHKVKMQVQCLAFSPDGAYLAIGLENGIVRLLKMKSYEIPTSSELSLTRDLKRNLPLACLSFSADASELVAAVREGSTVHVKTSPSPFISLGKHYLDNPIPVREDDDQGISSVIRCPKRNLLCITYWTRSGYPLLHDCLQKKGFRIKQAGTRVQQAVFSKSGKFLILINHNGSIFKVTINDIDSLKIDEIGKLRHLSHTIGKSQIVDVKFSEDEKELRLVWIKDNRAYITDSSLDSVSSPLSPRLARTETP